MIIYFIILLFIIFFSFNAQRNKSNILNKLNYYLISIILILFGGLRTKSVGTDTNNYVSIFDSFKGIGFWDTNESTLEVGFIFLQKIGHLISDDYYVILLIIAFCAVLPYVVLVKNYSYNYVVSFFIYFTLGIYLIYFNAARQSIAIAIFSFAFYYIYNRNLPKFLLIIFLASLFHQTVLLMLPFYFILKIKYHLKNYVLILLLTSIIFVFLGSFLNVVNDNSISKYSNYIDRGAVGGELLCLFYTLISIILIWIHRIFKKINIPELEEYEFYLKLCLFSSMIYLIVVLSKSDVNMIRLTGYFGLGYMLIWPIVFRYLKYIPVNHRFFTSTFIIIHLAFLYITLFKMARLVPYQFNINF